MNAMDAISASLATAIEFEESCARLAAIMGSSTDYVRALVFEVTRELPDASSPSDVVRRLEEDTVRGL